MTFQTSVHFNEITGYEGFHSFSNKVCYKNFGVDINIYKKCFFIKRFVYNMWSPSAAIAEGYLPKGTKYAVNKFGEIIYNCIVINKFTDL